MAYTKGVHSPLAVTVEGAINLTKRPRHVEAALYHLQRAMRKKTPVPPGCQLTLIRGDCARPMTIGLISVLRIKDLWARGIVPPFTPWEEAAMRAPSRV